MSLILRWSAARQQATTYRASQLCGLQGQVRNASLSAIHRGIRRSDRTGSQSDRGRRPDAKSRVTDSRGRSRNQDAPEKSDAFSDRFKGAIGGREHHFKPKKAFQKMQEREEEGGRKSRSKRFNNPEYSFGKKSLVYQLNRGELKDKVSKLLGEEGKGSQGSSSPRPGSAWRENFGTHASDADSSTNRAAEFPVAVQYTTAASQFLFGRSVVKAALKNSGRKLYTLYIYQGSNKKETRDDEWIVTMAAKKNVKINRVYEADQRLLDKMSKGRPHNGLVLEASPLPQLPLVSLGGFSNEVGGYTVSVARQSKEDVAINGTEGFIPWKAGELRPLVLLLNEILDPGNLGAILRTARFLGASAVAITERTSSTITSTVLKAAAGAAEELKIFTVEEPGSFLDLSEKAGWTSFAAVAPSPGSRQNRQWTLDTIEEFKPLQNDPCILVLGNEGTGLPDYLRRKSTHEVTIPRTDFSSSLVDSLNVSVAAGLLCSSFFRGAKPKDPLTLTERLQIDARKADGGEALF
ncbi:RNA family [Colletotrichum karsti]|uniref:rRNA methyltransferase 1, mitochondrial n=1 Tax=Colletotrichum karsti TaxID=1095194 RepID=A0A9P6LMZ9_9PEZI|nr:RNA family [Colletotrichum karsti]KAF9882029.1 RNA family [Colletotrichum karsti]